MYKLLRNTHLLLGLFLTLFVLMFGVSSMQMSHRDWIENKWEATEQTVAVDPRNAATPRALALQLMDGHGLRGALNEVKETPEEMRFVIGRMGTANEVRYRRGASEARLTRRVAPFIGMMIAMHRTFGFDKPYGPHVFWGALMFLTSVGLLVLAATGIYLWFKIHKERLIGSILLFGGLGFGLTMISLLWVG